MIQLPTIWWYITQVKISLLYGDVLKMTAINRMAERIEIKKNDKKVIRAWAMFDWANSAYSLVISTAIFPIYFLSVAPDTINILGRDMSDSSVYSYSISIAYLILALVAPLLGGIADAGNKRMSFLKIFTTLGGLSCIALFYFKSASLVWLGTSAFILSTIGFAGSLIFYDAFLPSIVTKENYDAVSAKGYSFGYVGSVLLLVFIIYLSKQPEVFGISAEDSLLPLRIGFILVGVWWIGWAQYTFKYLPKDKKNEGNKALLKDGYKEMRSVMGEMKEKPNLRRFLVSFFFYSAGVNTIIYLATIFASKELAFTDAELIQTVLLLQVVAVFGALAFAKYAKAKGSKKAISVMIVIWMIICVGASLVTSKTVFFVIAFFVGLVLGGIQASSRASYTKLIEGEDEHSSYFSFYDLLFYLSIVFGSAAFAFVDNLTNNLRYSVLVLALFFVVAFFIFRKVEINESPAVQLN